MAKLVDNERLARLAKALDDRAKAGVAAEKQRAEAAEKANAEAIAQEVEDREAAIEEAITFENGITTVNALGGIAAGESLDGMTAIEILDMLLFPYVQQVVGNPTRTPNATLLEKGNNQVITAVSVAVTKKSKPITKVELYNGSTLLATKEGDDVKNGGTITFSGLSVAVNSTNVVLTVKVTDEQGSVVSKTTPAWTFVYPYYYGLCEAGAVIDEALVEGMTKDIQSKGNKTYSYSPNNQCAVIAFPKANGVLTSALDPNAFENIAAFTRYEINITGLDGTAQAYYVYVSGAFTGSGFKYTFKH